MFLCTYASSRLKRKSFYRESELQMFLLLSGGHSGGPKRCTNMASQLKASEFFLSSYISRFLVEKSKLSVERSNTVNLDCKEVRDQFIEKP